MGLNPMVLAGLSARVAAIALSLLMPTRGAPSRWRLRFASPGQGPRTLRRVGMSCPLKGIRAQSARNQSAIGAAANGILDYALIVTAANLDSETYTAPS
ncbi:MAG: hypothetical protein DCC58_21150 [Chloroflexi bacterium]|nr:MAG: hypothetical protein DCC58_21150 [Chloroflexota bacterium]